MQCISYSASIVARCVGRGVERGVGRAWGGLAMRRGGLAIGRFGQFPERPDKYRPETDGASLSIPKFRAKFLSQSIPGQEPTGLSGLTAFSTASPSDAQTHNQRD